MGRLHAALTPRFFGSTPLDLDGDGARLRLWTTKDVVETCVLNLGRMRPGATVPSPAKDVLVCCRNKHQAVVGKDSLDAIPCLATMARATCGDAAFVLGPLVEWFLQTFPAPVEVQNDPKSGH